MTRTELIQVAKGIVHNPIDIVETRLPNSKIYSGIYLDNAFDVFVYHSKIIAALYDSVAYFINPVDRQSAPKMRSLCIEYDIKTKVYLYPESLHLIVDAEGFVDDRTLMRISNFNDYSDVIPIPYKM